MPVWARKTPQGCIADPQSMGYLVRNSGGAGGACGGVSSAYGGGMMWETVAAAAAYQAFGAQELARVQALMQQQTGMYGHQIGMFTPSRPCPYCHRTSQTHGHKSCDGCGAPR